MFNRHRQASRLEEATRSRERAEQELARVQSETPVYAGLARSLRELREQNHFALAISATFRGGHR